jgi:uncharacterized protein (DUF4415 family)
MTKKLSVSSRRERLRRVKPEDITLTEKMAKELELLKNRKVDLTDKDAPEITGWDKAIVGKFYRPIKKQITIRIDADVLVWFKHATKKYQTLINMACREYMLHHEKSRKRTKVRHA